MRVLRIDERALADLRRHGEEAYPLESCGILLGRAPDGDGERIATAAVRCRNARADRREDRYAVDPGEILRADREARARGEEIVGFYHSHPDHPARPSPTDLAEAHWLGCSYLITRVAEGRAGATASFRLGGQGEEDRFFEDEEIRVEPGGGST